MRALDVYKGSDGDVTRAYYAELQKRGPLGVVAMNLFRAQKASERAKLYRGGIRGQGSFRSMAYERKGYAMQMLCEAIQRTEHALVFGWKQDPKTILHGDDAWVLYVDLPVGQVSFHSSTRYVGPDYAGDWDGQRASVERILAFCDAVIEQKPATEMQAVKVSPAEPCSCAVQMCRNNLDGSRDFKMQGKTRCRKCHGRGYVRKCSDCGGTGVLNSQACSKCGGYGSVSA